MTIRLHGNQNGTDSTRKSHGFPRIKSVISLGIMLHKPLLQQTGGILGCFCCIAGPLSPMQSGRVPWPYRPPFVANRAGSVEAYSYAITPAGWLVDCHGFAFPQLSRIGGGLTLHRWRFVGASRNCAVSELDPDGAHEHYYFGRQASQTAEMVRGTNPSCFTTHGRAWTSATAPGTGAWRSPSPLPAQARWSR